MEALAEAERFEEAADARDRAAALAGALARQRRLDGLRRAGRVVLDVPGTGAAELAHGRLVRVRRRLQDEDGSAPELPLQPAPAPSSAPPPPGPLAPSEVDEVACVARWLEESAAKVRLVSCDGELASPVAVLPRFDPAPARRTLRG
jgi:DNA polymerase-3 subunit epsilon